MTRERRRQTIDAVYKEKKNGRSKHKESLDIKIQNYGLLALLLSLMERSLRFVFTRIRSTILAITMYSIILYYNIYYRKIYIYISQAFSEEI